MILALARGAVLAVLFILGTVIAFAFPARAEPVDVALVIAMDVSGSVSDESWRLQRDGVAEAIGSRRFALAVQSGQRGRIAVAVVQWGSDARLAVGWRVIGSADQARGVAAEIRMMARAESGATCAANALVKAGAELMAWEEAATRRVIDVSGDGSDNCSTDIADARAAVIAQGITINGLPIITPGEPAIVEWYENKVIGGAGAFVVVAEGFGSFATAMLQKLIVEVAEVRP